MHCTIDMRIVVYYTLHNERIIELGFTYIRNNVVVNFKNIYLIIYFI